MLIHVGNQISEETEIRDEEDGWLGRLLAPLFIVALAALFFAMLWGRDLRLADGADRRGLASPPVRSERAR